MTQRLWTGSPALWSSPALVCSPLALLVFGGLPAGSLCPLSTWLRKSSDMPSAIHFPAWTHALGTARPAPSASSAWPHGRTQGFQPSHTLALGLSSLGCVGTCTPPADEMTLSPLMPRQVGFGYGPCFAHSGLGFDLPLQVEACPRFESPGSTFRNLRHH